MKFKFKYKDPHGMKYCRKCGECKKLDNNNFWKNNSAYDGWTNRCIPCKKEELRLIYSEKKLFIIKRRCKLCEGFFYTTKARIKAGNGKFCCRECFSKSEIGENNGSAVLNEKNVKKIKQILNNGEKSLIKIAKRFKTTNKVIWLIKHNKTWKHVLID